MRALSPTHGVIKRDRTMAVLAGLISSRRLVVLISLLLCWVASVRGLDSTWPEMAIPRIVSCFLFCNYPRFPSKWKYSLSSKWGKPLHTSVARKTPTMQGTLTSWRLHLLEAHVFYIDSGTISPKRPTRMLIVLNLFLFAVVYKIDVG